MSAALANLPANLTYLDLGNNALSGALGSAPCGLPGAGLQALYLGSNALTGSLPACLFSSGAVQRALRSRAAVWSPESLTSKHNRAVKVPHTSVDDLPGACPDFFHWAVRGNALLSPSARLGCF